MPSTKASLVFTVLLAFRGRWRFPFDGSGHHVLLRRPSTEVEELAAEDDLAYLDYDKFAQAKDVSDSLITLWAANSRAIEIKINQLRGLTGK